MPAGNVDDCTARAYGAWARDGEGGLSKLIAEARIMQFDSAPVLSNAAAFEAVANRCVISAIKARFLRGLLAAHDETTD